MPRMRKLSKEEIRARRAEISASARAGKLRLPSAVLIIRHALGLNQKEFAKTFRLTLRQVKELEKGTANPTAGTLNRIAKVFGFSLGFVPRHVADHNVSSQTAAAGDVKTSQS
ncbi:MAG TPA: helix-turn-helix transcriptional regulator [Pseudolabrys sp.]|nr:helix-turn-helix transcriptional regulator [Pseudolabrys sp.]